jgi:hypothetical protein
LAKGQHFELNYSTLQKSDSTRNQRKRN